MRLITKGCDLAQEMHQRFTHSGPKLFLCDPATGLADCFLDRINRIGRTGSESRISSIKHRDIIVVIARGENIFPTYCR